MKLNRMKDDMDVRECMDYDVIVFGGGKKFSLFWVLIYTSRKPVRCTGKLLKIKSKLILIHIFFFFFFVVQNVVGKIDKETLRIGFRINLFFWFKKITKKVFTIE